MEAPSPIQNMVGYTGGQFSAYRIALSLHILSLLLLSPTPSSATPALLLSPTSPLHTPLTLIAAPLLALALAAGFHTRYASLTLALILTSTSSLPALTSTSSSSSLLPTIACLLFLALSSVSSPPPYGAWHASSRTDPRGAWALPPSSRVLAWALILLAHANSILATLAPGVQPLSSPLSFLLIASIPALGSPALCPSLWAASAGITAVSAALGGGVGMLLVHGLAWEPHWVPPAHQFAASDRLFYDGDCGLCHRFIRFTMAESQAVVVPFIYTPLQSPLCQRILEDNGLYAPGIDAPLPDSVLVATHDGRLLMKAEAAFYALGRLGGAWRILGELGALLPTTLANFGYDTVAASRHKIFAKPKTGACPLLPKPYRKHFDLGDLPEGDYL